jgi:hypothetical protein
LSDEGSPLSEKEEALITFAESVKNCTGGKFEGVANFYAQGLEPKDKFKIEIPNEPDKAVAEAKAILVEEFQNCISSQFSGTNPLMMELTGVTKIQQASHQSIYLKNLIAHIVGLQHNLTFDMHSGVLYDKLINLSREEVLEIFFKHFTPETLVNHVHAWMNRNSDIPERKNWDKVFTLAIPNEDDMTWDPETDMPTDPNRSYARKVLVRAGYLTE